MEVEGRTEVVRFVSETTQKEEEIMNKTKPFSISMEEVQNAWTKVKSNKGSYGIDGESIKDFETNLEDNLYKIWNRMSSGSYFPPAVLGVEIPKKSGGVRVLGIPTVGDRVAQMVAKLRVEPILEQIFHPDSYGYRPNKSAHDALETVRQRCWKYDWVIDMDIKGLFDNISHELLMKAVEKHIKEPWILLYIKRWLNSPMKVNERVVERTKGTPQGGVISPILANLFMHYVMDKWLEKELPTIPFVRYADDMIVNCKSLSQAKMVLARIKQRLKECKLELNEQKTRIVYCKDTRRKEEYENTEFDFLGFTFKQRKAYSKYSGVFMGFQPAISLKAQKALKLEVRQWNLNTMVHMSPEEMAGRLNPKIQGWINYYGKYEPRMLNKVFRKINVRITIWARRKYKNLKDRKAVIKWFLKTTTTKSTLFVHWKHCVSYAG